MPIELRPLLEQLENPQASVRLDAATWLRDASPPLADAIPALVAHLDDPRRLLFAGGGTDQLAAEELGAVAAPGNQRAAALLAGALLHEPRPGLFALTIAATSLDKLGPVLDATTAAQLIAIAPTRAMFHCWPELLPAVASYGHAAASLGPWLLSWVQDDAARVDIGTEHHAAVRNAAALAIARLGDAARPLHDALAEIYLAGPDKRRELVLRAVPDRSVLVDRLGARWRQTLAGGDRKAIEETLGMLLGVRAAAAPLVDAIVPFAEGRHGDYHATLTLGELGEAARPFVPVLIRALADSHSSAWACISLRKLGPSIVGDAAIAPLEGLGKRPEQARRHRRGITSRGSR